MKSVPFLVTKTNHIVIEVNINNVLGNFLVDTGASNSCICFNSANKFNITSEHSANNVKGIGGDSVKTEFSEGNTIRIGEFMLAHQDIVLTDFSQLNDAFSLEGIDSVDGIIGGDLLVQAKAIIDYFNHKVIFTIN